MITPISLSTAFNSLLIFVKVNLPTSTIFAVFANEEYDGD